MRIELTPKAWEAPVLPLNYTRISRADNTLFNAYQREIILLFLRLFYFGFSRFFFGDF